jgi:D-alanyl-D-alanine carboxypeptidase
MGRLAGVIAALAIAAGITAEWTSRATPTASPALAAELQATLEDARAELGVPGVSAAAVDDGTLVWSGAVGVRSLGGPAVEPATRFITASAGKTVTAAIVLRLADEGELALGDRVSKYVSGLRGARRVRIRHLLEHSSGLPDYLSYPEIYRLMEREPAHAWTRDEVLDVVGSLRFRPGSRARYSNTNYIVLGGVTEAVTGLGVEDAYHRYVAGPLELTGSSWLYDSSLFAEGAHPHRETRDFEPTDAWDEGFVPTDFVGEVWTDGGLATTGADLALIANELIAGDLLSRASRRDLLRFRERGFGRGVFRYRFAGDPIIGHDGLYDGFTAQHWTDPRSGLTIAVLANLETRGGDPSWSIWKRLWRIADP